MTDEKSRSFWEKHSAQYQTAFEKIPELARYLERSETRHVFRAIETRPEMAVLDLGCGTGRWAFEFATRCQRVVAVDFAAGMIERARAEAARRGLQNIEFHVAGVEDFRTDERFDIIIVSGVLVYFPDAALPEILANIRQHLKPGGKVISRETVAIHQRQELDSEYHEKIQDAYSAIYRLPAEYERLFRDAGLHLLYAEDFTPTNFPMILYRRLVPPKWRQNRLLRGLLNLGLQVQYVADPFLLRHKTLYRPIMNRFWKIKSMLFVYGIDS